MSVRIRLRRTGRKKQPYFRVVVAKRDAPRDGAYIDEVGFYNPRTRPALLTMDLEKVDAWIGKGAEVSESAMALIRKARKGGDKDMTFVAPGEEIPRLKTATKPERRPAPAAPAVEAETPEPEAPEAEAEADVEEAADVEAEAPEAEAPEAEAEEAAEVEAKAPEAEAEAETETEADETEDAEESGDEKEK